MLSLAVGTCLPFLGGNQVQQEWTVIFLRVSWTALTNNSKRGILYQRGYTYEVLSTGLPTQDLNKDDINGHANMEGGNPAGPLS